MQCLRRNDRLFVNSKSTKDQKEKDPGVSERLRQKPAKFFSQPRSTSFFLKHIIFYALPAFPATAELARKRRFH